MADQKTSKPLKETKSTVKRSSGSKKPVKETNARISEEENKTERIEIKAVNPVPGEIKVIDSETSGVLEQLKKKEIANKPATVSGEEKDRKIVEEETKADEGIERFTDTEITVGLNDEQIALRKSQHLTNAETHDKGKSYPEIILTNIFTFFNMLYLVITIILIIVGESKQLIFLAAVIPNIIIGMIQEINSKRIVDKLRLMSAPVAIVIRNGDKLEIPVGEVVLDDVIMYTAGKQICADSIVAEGTVEVNEALLTGEADAVTKVPGSKLLAGSFVASGTCVARVERVGKEKYISKMSAEAKKYTPPRSELLRTLKHLIRVITVLLIPVAVLYLLMGAGRIEGESFSELIRRIFAKEKIAEIAYIILAMIPAGLFLLTGVALAFGVIRLGRNKTLVQQLYCIEMLARVDVLCLDKTGTITDGTMRVCDCVEVNNHTDYTIREIIGSMMSSFKETNPTGEALIKYFDTNTVLQPLAVIPFSSKRKYSAVTFDREGTFILGAPDFVIKDSYNKIAAKVARFSNQGCRVLALGHVGTKIRNEELPKSVNPLALIIIRDHIRDDASDTIGFFKQNGVDIKVISGDDPETAAKIADRVGVENAGRFINTGGMSDEELKDSVFDYTVFGRVSPSQKKLIIKTLKENGRTVAMTGDGVNDIPALKEADCSIAMASGSEATRYVSHLVLMNSDFSSMPKVVNEGRRVINNIQKISALYLTKNVFAFLIAVMYIIIGFSVGPDSSFYNMNKSFPFNPRSLLMIELIILGFATLCLSLQPNREIVKGKFLANVFRQIMPGTITILIYQLLLFFSQNFRGIFGDDYSPWFPELSNAEVFKTISSLLTTIIMLFVLYRACKPFNWFRKIVFILVFAAITLVITIPVLREEVSLNFNDFGNIEKIFTCMLILGVYPVMTLVERLLIWIHVIPKDKENDK